MKETKTTERIRVPKEALIAAIDDISSILDFEDAPDFQKISIKEIVAFLNTQQDGEDAFQAEDFTIGKDGKTEGLTADTVKTLIAAGVTVPKEWAGWLEKLSKFAKPAKLAKPDAETEFLEEVAKAAHEDQESDEEEEEESDEEENPAPKGEEKPDEEPKKAKPATKKQSNTKGAAGGTKIKKMIAFVTPLIEKGIEQKVLIEKLIKEFPETASATFTTQLYRAQNPKYKAFGKLVKKTAGVLSFE